MTYATELFSQRFTQIRRQSLSLTSGLTAEDQCIQSMPDASPTKWHLAHTTWFFEALLLRHYLPHYRVFNPAFHYLFNSYYESLGPRQPRPQRGLLSRPSLAQVLAYREHVDAAMAVLFASLDTPQWQAVGPVLELGLHHEQQHQELIVMDIVHAFSCHPMLPAYGDVPLGRLCVPGNPDWLAHEGGMVDVGHGGDGFAFDNETPRHPVWLQPYAIADRLVSCGDYLAFMNDGGYRRPEFWLSEGWAALKAQSCTAPLYWLDDEDPRRAHHTNQAGWLVYGIGGVQPLDPNAPVSNLNFYEACAYAEWAQARLPTEFEWEAAADAEGIYQMFGHGWQWTRSAYAPYPGFRPLPGPAAEYNGKFMVGQQVLRGSSCATPAGHARSTYRNFFPPGARWPFSGLRLARDL